MKVTDCKFKGYTSGALVGFADITFDDVLKVTGITVFKKAEVISYALPSKKKGEEYYDIVFVLDPDLKGEILVKIKEKMGVVDSGETDGLPF